MPAGRGENQFSPTACHWVYQPSRVGPVPRSSGPTQNGLHGLSYTLFWSSFVLFILFLSVLTIIFCCFSFLREREKNIMSGEQGGGKDLGEAWESEKNMIKIYFMKNANKYFTKCYANLKSFESQMF